MNASKKNEPGDTPAGNHPSSHESSQIFYCRIFCIFFMTFTHLKFYEESIVYEGQFASVGHLVIDYLGRASVAALSFISGYLTLKSGSGRKKTPLLKFVRRKTGSVLVPMLMWNMFYILAVVSAHFAFSYEHRIVPILYSGSWLEKINIFTGLFADPANFSLFFIRDLFIAQIIIFAISFFPLILSRYLLLAVCAVSLFLPMDPVIFREPVLTFLSAGALLALSNTSLYDLSRSAFFRVICIALLVPLVMFEGSQIISVLGSSGFNIYKRMALTAMVLIISYFLVGSVADRPIKYLAQYAFLFYLIHLPVTSFFWIIWAQFFPNIENLTYAIYFFGAPILAFVIANLVARSLRKAPQLARILGVRS